MNSTKTGFIVSFLTFFLLAATLFAAGKTDVTIVERPGTASVNANYRQNRAPLLPQHFIKLPVGDIKPLGWLQKTLSLQKNGLNGQLGEISAWLDKENNAWLGEVDPPIDYGRPVRVFVKRRWKDGQFLHSYYISTLSLPSKGCFLRLYDDRGGAEVEQLRNDKSGLSMEARRKRSFTGQKGYSLLTDLAHNLLADVAHRGLADSTFAAFGPKRIVRDLLKMPGLVTLADNQAQIDLLSQNHFSEELAMCLVKYCSSDLGRLEIAPVCTKK